MLYIILWCQPDKKWNQVLELILEQICSRKLFFEAQKKFSFEFTFYNQRNHEDFLHVYSRDFFPFYQKSWRIFDILYAVFKRFFV